MHAELRARFTLAPSLTKCPLSSPCRWAFLELHTNDHYNDSLQAYAAGVVEAAVSEEVRARCGTPGFPPPIKCVPQGALEGSEVCVEGALPPPAFHLVGEKRLSCIC